VVERVATLEEIERHWSIDDLADGNDALTAYQRAMAEAQETAAKKGR
jgi:hypothetical protein